MITKEKVAILQQLIRAASPGPWLLFGPPWADAETAGTFALAGAEDPHVGHAVLQWVEVEEASVPPGPDGLIDDEALFEERARLETIQKNNLAAAVEAFNAAPMLIEHIAKLERDLQSARDTEAERWQKRFDFLAAEYGADGGGCESGDPLDFTESEVQQALTKLMDERDDARTDAAAAQARVEELERSAREWFNADGSVTILATAEEVRERRLAAALGIAALEAEASLAASLLHGLVCKCYVADCREDLGDVDFQPEWNAFERCTECGGFGTVDQQPHEDEVIAPENVCPACRGMVIVPRLSRASSSGALRQLLMAATTQAVLDRDRRVTMSEVPEGPFKQLVISRAEAIVDSILSVTRAAS